MKKNLLISLGLLAIIALPSCANEGTDQDNVKLDVPTYVNDFLKEASASYKLKALEKEIVKKTDGTTMFTNEYSYNITSLRGERPSIKETFSKSTTEGTSSSTIRYVKNERGYVSVEGINYKNEVFLTEATDSDGKKLIYDKEFPNPFEYLTINDFEAIEVNGKSIKKAIEARPTTSTLLLNKDKQAFFAKYLLGIDYTIDNVKFNFVMNKIDSIQIDSVVSETRYQDAYTSMYIPVNVNYETTVLIDNVGSAEFDGAKPHTSKNKEREDALKNALTNLGDNYTLIINEHYQGEKGNSEFDSYWYFNGKDAIYHQQHLDDTSRKFDLYYKKDPSKADDLMYIYDLNETTNKWVYIDPTNSQSYNVRPKTYAELDTKARLVDPTLFEYDETENKYVVTDGYVSAFLGNAFLPGCYQIKDFTIGGGNKAEVVLTSDGKIDAITVGFFEVDSNGYDISREYIMRFININKTTIPSWVKGE